MEQYEFPVGQRLIIDHDKGTWIAMDYDRPGPGKHIYIHGYTKDMSNATKHERSYTKDEHGTA